MQWPAGVLSHQRGGWLCGCTVALLLLLGSETGGGSLAESSAALVADPPDPKICDVMAHGARGDNVTDDTSAFVAAIAACSGAAPTGRGVVLAPAPGRYLLKPLELKDNVELQILAGARLVLWPYGASYPNYTSAHVRPGGEIPEAGCFNNPTESFTCVSSGCKQRASQIPMSFLWGENVSNVAIGGGGTIDGQGLAWWLNSWWKRHDLNMYWRPKLLEFPGATDLTLGGPKGLLLVDSPMWNTALHRNTRLTVTNVTVHSPSAWINTDGIRTNSNHRCRFGCPSTKSTKLRDDFAQVSILYLPGRHLAK